MSEPRDGAYVVTRRDGLALIYARAQGRIVEVIGTIHTDQRPGRRTTRRLGDSWAAVLEERRRARELAFAEAMADAGLGRLSRELRDA